MSANRKATSMAWEVGKATLAIAGIRQILRTNISATNGADTTYTVADKATRRVVAVHLNAGNGDLRFNINAAAAATDIPVVPARYFVVDAAKGDVLHFFNTTAGAFTVYLLEIE